MSWYLPTTASAWDEGGTNYKPQKIVRGWSYGTQKHTTSQNGCEETDDFYLLKMPSLFVLFFVCFFGFLSFFLFCQLTQARTKAEGLQLRRGSQGIAIGKTVAEFS